MNVHEYQAKALLRTYDVPVGEGQVAFSVPEAVAAAESLGGDAWVVKAQIHAGGRGKGGGVKIAKSTSEVKQFAETMLGMTLVTTQTGPEGKLVKKIYVEKACAIAKELYFSMLIDRSSQRIVAMASTEGGMDIEEADPNAIKKVFIDPTIGFQDFHGRRLAYGLGLNAAAGKFFAKVYKAFVSTDAELIEINPLVMTKTDELVALDAKINFDDNALYRHPNIEAMRDEDEEDPAELEAKRNSLNYVKLNGNIGCMVNGAGLAMATMDAIKLYGGQPANFLDVGGGATRERVTTAFKLILSDPNVEAILVNIFGGIMRCDIIADGIVEAAKEMAIKVPLIVRLEGTNVELGKEILAKSGMKILTADTLGDAAQKAVGSI